MGGKSQYEETLELEATAAGFELFRGGWPDYVLVRAGEVIFLEVKKDLDKAHGTNQSFLSVEQLRMLRLLERCGLKVRIAVDGKLSHLVTVDVWIKKTWRVMRVTRTPLGKSVITIEKAS